jgi:shikimate kinase/3-dehydroquinate synthase
MRFAASWDPPPMSDGVVLVGLPGSGKSTAGRLLASALGRPFVDTDEIVAAPAGGNIAARLRELGEPAFREAESRAIEEALGRPGAVIATGAGALDDPLNRWRLWQHGTAFWLDAADEVLLRRLSEDPVVRPLLDGDPAGNLARLRERRAPFYRAARTAVNADRPATQVRDAIIDTLKPAAHRGPGLRLFDAEVARHHVIGPATTRVIYGCGLLPQAVDEQLTDIGGMPRHVVDRAVDHALGSQPRTYHLPGGERAKRLRVVERLLAWLAEQRTERGDPVVAVGGGSIGDVAGFAAAVFARGIPWIGVPTTWLAQADAALGGKVAVNLQHGKNAAGAFWPPSAVIADVAAVRTLPARHARNGLAEAAKAGLIGDPALWRLIEKRGVAAIRGDEAARYALIERAARVKLGIVDRDPFEQGERRLLNLGHTIGHALEQVSRYRLAHGSAVALGLCAAGELGRQRGADPDLAPGICEVLRKLGFKTRIVADGSAIRNAIGSDKKRAGGRQRWILPMAIGSVVEVDDVTDVELDAALRSIGIGA